MNRLTQISLVLVAAIAVSAVVAYSIHRDVLGPAKAREEAFAAIQSGQLTADAQGVVALPAQWAMASTDGKAYLTRNTDRALWALFVKERGLGNRIEGYLFCDKPAQAAAKGSVEVNFPTRDSLVTVKIMRVASPYSFEVVSDTKR